MSVVSVDEIGGELSFSLDHDDSPQCHAVAQRLGHLCRFFSDLQGTGKAAKKKDQTLDMLLCSFLPPSLHFSDLNFVQDSSTVHPASHIDSIPPNVILGLVGTDHPRNHWTMVYSYDKL